MSVSKSWRPFVSVIVPTYNEPRLVLALEALRAQTYGRNLYEIVVCDNGSACDVRTVVRSVSKDVAARVVAEPRSGSYAARNAALREASGSVFAFTDADCLPAGDWIASGVAALGGSRGPDMVAGRIDVFAGGLRPTLAELYELVAAFPQQRYAECENFGATANLMVRREVFTRIGMFDASLRSGGDWEFGNRATAAGFRLVYDDAVLVRHPARRHLSELRRKQRRTSRGLFDSGILKPSMRDALFGFRPPLRTIVGARQRRDVRSHGTWGRYAAVATFIHYGLAVDRLRHVLGILPDHRESSTVLTDVG